MQTRLNKYLEKMDSRRKGFPLSFRRGEGQGEGSNWRSDHHFAVGQNPALPLTPALSPEAGESEIAPAALVLLPPRNVKKRSLPHVCSLRIGRSNLRPKNRVLPNRSFRIHISRRLAQYPPVRWLLLIVFGCALAAFPARAQSTNSTADAALSCGSTSPAMFRWGTIRRPRGVP